MLYIVLNRLMPSGPFWWTAPGLRDVGEGATIWEWRGDKLLWLRPGVQLPDERPDLG